MSEAQRRDGTWIEIRDEMAERARGAGLVDQARILERLGPDDIMPLAEFADFLGLRKTGRLGSFVSWDKKDGLIKISLGVHANDAGYWQACSELRRALNALRSIQGGAPIAGPVKDEG